MFCTRLNFLGPTISLFKIETATYRNLSWTLQTKVGLCCSSCTVVNLLLGTITIKHKNYHCVHFADTWIKYRLFLFANTKEYWRTWFAEIKTITFMSHTVWRLIEFLSAPSFSATWVCYDFDRQNLIAVSYFIIILSVFWLMI